MFTTVGFGTMLLGSWVLVSPVEDNLPPLPATPPPTAAAQARPVQSDGTSNESNFGGLRRPSGQGYGGGMRDQERGSRFGPRENKNNSPSQRPGDTGMPASPTGSMQGAGGLGMPLPPTADPAMEQAPGYEQQGAMDQAYGSAGSRMPMAPTATARPAPSSGFSGRGSGGGRMSSGSQGLAPQTIGASNQPTQKAFASVNPYSSGVSPYMNLFRNDTNAGTVDNYTTLVRPALEQRAANQRFNMDIYGLERRARIQQHSLQKMQQTERRLQGVGTPQYYMNYGGFYGN